MSRSQFNQTNFNAGEFSEFVGSRFDSDLFDRGSSLLENWLVTVEGPITKRPGSRFIAPQADETRKARLVPFVFSAAQTYELEFGHNTLRVFRDKQLVLDSSYATTTVQSVTPASPLEVLLTTTSGLSTGDMIFIDGTSVPEINGQFHRITIVGGSNIVLDGLDGTTFPAQVSPAGTVELVYSVASPYTADQAQTIQFVQSNDVVYIACAGLPRRKLSRLADDDWTFTVLTGEEEDSLDNGLASWPPFSRLNTDPIFLSISADTAPGGSVTITSDVTGVFSPSDVGRYIMLQRASIERGYGRVTAYVDTDEVTVEVLSRFPNADAGRGFSASVITPEKTRDWAWSAFDDVNGHPKAVALFDGRLFWASSDTDPSVIVASVADSYEDHRPYNASPTDPDLFAVTSGSGFVVNPRSDTNDAIEWLRGLDVLFFGTRGGEWILGPSDPELAVGPSNLLIRQRGRVGSRPDASPLAVDSVVLYPQRAGRRLKELVYDDTTKSYQSPDMTRLNRWITLGRIKHMAFQQEPYRIVWVVLEDGGLRAFTYDRVEQVAAWARVPLAGTDVVVEGVSVIPSATEDEDEVWLTVRRTVNGQTRRYVEVLERFWDEGDDITEAFFVDSGLIYDGASATTIYGLLHLIGEQVQILSQGSFEETLTVDARGRVVLAEATTKAVIGMEYAAKRRSLRPEFGGSALKSASAAGHRKRPERLALRLIETGPGIEIGNSFENMVELPMRDPSDLMDTPVPLFTGDTGYKSMPGQKDFDGYSCIRHSKPLPATVSAAFAQMVSEEVP